ncbi:hypothetical protein ANCCEY_02522 [Ancylostoma ceylanicum]|uniref:Uncharacterized protein n=1 Tax=Ancylostoma ceylanicum TaxID=53326 RepID=A0A0D6M4G8_9BILA|nr:hypothetical protein ANCCEY_02522 [Ancylostoma ceylanicum]
MYISSAIIAEANNIHAQKCSANEVLCTFVDFIIQSGVSICDGSNRDTEVHVIKEKWQLSLHKPILEEYERLTQHLCDSAKKIESSRTTKRRPSHETLELIRQRGAARAASNYQLTSELAKRCREAIREDLKERRAAALAEAQGKASATPAETSPTKGNGEGHLRLLLGPLRHVHLPPRHLREDGYVIPSVLPSEVRHAIKSVKNRTAPGPDRIRPEHLRNLPTTLVNTLARLFTRYLLGCKVPSQWKTSRTVLLYKKGDPQDIGNYRPICLLSVVYKLFTRKAFDTVETETVLEALGNQGVPTQYIRIFRELYSNFTTRISPFYDDITIDVRRGIRQSDTVSPKLFTATLEDIMRRLEWDNMGVRIDGRLLHHHRFADDIVLASVKRSVCWPTSTTRVEISVSNWI